MATNFSLTPEQTREFKDAGMLHIPCFFHQRTVAEMADRIWVDMSRRFGIDRARRETWTTQRPAQFQTLIASGAFEALADGFQSVADAFLGEGNWDRPHRLGQPLITFSTGVWTVPHNMWHIDLPPENDVGSLPVVRVFVLLERVGRKGGGTCYVEGSHRVIVERAAALHRRMRSADVKATLKDHPWFAALFSKQDEAREQRLMIDGDLAWGVEVRVKETAGEAGDIYVMHPAMLHTVAENGLDLPRVMLVQPLFRRRTPRA